MAQARVARFACAVEGDRRRHADRPLRARWQGRPGSRPLGGHRQRQRRRRPYRELEIADLLRFVQRAEVRNTVWLTADVHYCAAHHYSPERAAFKDFAPFWEFVAGPLNAGSFGPNALDGTFGPQVMFQKAPLVQNSSPSPATSSSARWRSMRKAARSPSPCATSTASRCFPRNCSPTAPEPRRPHSDKGVSRCTLA